METFVPAMLNATNSALKIARSYLQMQIAMRRVA